MQNLTIVDTFGFLFRSYFALPPLKNKDGFPTGLLMGFANMLMSLCKEREFLIFALEGENNKRKELYPAYKATRQELPQDLGLQLPIALEWIEKMGFSSIKIPGYEADDVIASLSRLARLQGFSVEILSHDKDLCQLINEEIKLYDPMKKSRIGEKECFQKFGVYPKDFVDYQSLIGDSSDNVPGIPGIGPKIALRLLEHFHTLDGIYSHIDELDALFSPHIVQKVKEGRQSAYLSRDLVRLHHDLLDDFDFAQARIKEANPLEKIIEDLEKFEFYKILQRVKKLPANVSMSTIRAKGIGGLDYRSARQFSFVPHLITDSKRLFEILESIPEGALIAYDCETTSLNVMDAKLVGFSFCFDGRNGYYVPVAHSYLGVGAQIPVQDAIQAIEKIFSHPITGHNLKYDFLIAYENFHITPAKDFHDTMILAWLWDSASLVGMDALMERHFRHKMIAYESLIERGQIFSDVDLNRASEYASEDAVASLALYHKFYELFALKNCQPLMDLAKSLEFPFVCVLMDMERAGIKIDCQWFENLRLELSAKLSQLEKDIFATANQTFNVNSPKQLSEVLFTHLKLRGVRQIKGGFSTDEQTLEEIYDDHPIIPLILEYRENFKLKNTYVEPMLKLKNQENRIHTSFLQTGTTTGRLSSRSPNLQNIPVRTEAGRQIRRGFIASSGKKLLSIDYSQIELRLLAHFSQDPELVRAFRENVDIHLRTAEILFGPAEAKDKRHIAKTINFGLIYGMGSRKLAKTLKIKSSDAKAYIERYFASFPTTKSFLAKQEEEIIKLGYAQTLLGHRRYFNFKNASEFMRANYLREGINAIFQGSAADLIKLSMLKIHARFKDTEVRMLLQVHDELIFELPASLCQSASDEIAEIMNRIYPLHVPLQCNVAIGDTWADLK